MLSPDYLTIFVNKLIEMSNKEGFNMKNESNRYIELFKSKYGNILSELASDENLTSNSSTPTTIIPQLQQQDEVPIPTLLTNASNILNEILTSSSPEELQSEPTEPVEQQQEQLNEEQQQQQHQQQNNGILEENESGGYSFSTLNKHEDMILSSDNKTASSTKNEYCYVLLNFCIEKGIYIIKYQLTMDEGNYGDIMFGLTKSSNANNKGSDYIMPIFKMKDTIVFDGNEGTKYVDGVITEQTGLRIREGAEIECRIDVNNKKYIIKVDELEDEEIYSGDVKGYYPFVEFFASPLMTVQLMDVKHVSN